jgi:murein DD-endopeptidase MepM/ murein hydrolase activator NlpD
MAPEEGDIVDSQQSLFGYRVILKGRSGMTHVFLHLREDLPSKGPIKRGQILGYVGPRYFFENGYSSGPHLHYGLKNPQGDYIDPGAYFQIASREK